MTTGMEGERIAAAAAVALHLEGANEATAAAIAVGLHLEGKGALAVPVPSGLSPGGNAAPGAGVDWWRTAGRLDALGGRVAVQAGRRSRRNIL